MSTVISFPGPGVAINLAATADALEDAGLAGARAYLALDRAESRLREACRTRGILPVLLPQGISALPRQKAPPMATWLNGQPVSWEQFEAAKAENPHATPQRPAFRPVA